MKCPNCGHMCVTSTCPVCGTKLKRDLKKGHTNTSIPNHPVKCPNCGRECVTSTCPVCHTKIWQLSNGSKSVAAPKRVLSESEILGRKFRANDDVGYIAADYSNQIFAVNQSGNRFTKNRHYYPFSSLISFNILELDGDTISKQNSGGVGRAVVGGLLFGEAGAIVGASTSGRTSEQTTICNSLYLEIILRSSSMPKEEVYFIQSGISKSSQEFKKAMEVARDCASILQRVKDIVRQNEKETKLNQGKEFSSADEIMKFKKLADAGIITQEEFEAKKKKLLDL